MSDPMQYDFRMQIAGEKPFEVYRFGYDLAGFHDSSGGNANSDSLQATRLGLQNLCYVIEASKTMLLTKFSDLVTVRLVETYLQRKTLDHIYFVASETANKKRTPVWVASLFLKNVSIVNLRTRQQFGVGLNGEPFLVDWVALRANEAFHRDYDSQGNPELKLDEHRKLFGRDG